MLSGVNVHHDIFYLFLYAMTMVCICLSWLLSTERSRKRHKTDDRATKAKRRALPALPSATTPLSVYSSSPVQDPTNSSAEDGVPRVSDDEDDLDLPAINLPGTPTTETEMCVASVTPESVVQRTRRGSGSAVGVASVTPESVVQRTRRSSGSAVGVVTGDKRGGRQGGTTKERRCRQSTGGGTGSKKRKSSDEHSEDTGARSRRKGRVASAVKECEAVGKTTCK